MDKNECLGGGRKEYVPQQQAAARVPVSYQNTQQPAQAGQNTQDYGERRFSEEDYQRIPAYPGGPVPGEDAQTPIDGDLVQSGDNSANGERKGG